MKFKEQFSRFTQYLIASLFCISSLVLTVFTLIAYVYGIIKIIKTFGLNVSENLSTSEVVGKILIVFVIILIALIILAILAVFIYMLYKLCVRLIKNVSSDSLQYFLSDKKWIDAIFAFVLSVAVGLGFRFLFNYLIAWHNNLLCYILAGAYLLSAILLFSYWLYLTLWFRKQKPEFKEKVKSILNEIKVKREEKKHINKNN